GFIVSAELVLVLTIGVLGMVVGLASVKDAITSELNDLADAFGTVDQSFNVRGLQAAANGGKGHASALGFGFNDRQDDCDCKGLTTIEVCGKTQGGSATTEGSN
ncbi:MAG: hypothetical protein IAG10_35545, partial [Planctomycetaceae bacterium]|nr:hypothetical protein [Planctomycetaceae bacterium]